VYVSTHKLPAVQEIITYTGSTWTKLTFMLTPRETWGTDEAAFLPPSGFFDSE